MSFGDRSAGRARCSRRRRPGTSTLPSCSSAGAVISIDGGPRRRTLGRELHHQRLRRSARPRRCSSPATGTAGRDAPPPPGLAGGASGCFTADNEQADQPITVSDQGEFVAIAVRKVEPRHLRSGSPGAVFDLVPDASERLQLLGPVPSCRRRPAGVGTRQQHTRRDRTTGRMASGHSRCSSRATQYCAVEAQPPPNYTAEPEPAVHRGAHRDRRRSRPRSPRSPSPTRSRPSTSRCSSTTRTPGTGIPGADLRPLRAGPAAAERRHGHAPRPTRRPRPATPGTPAAPPAPTGGSHSASRPATRGASSR